MIKLEHTISMKSDLKKPIKSTKENASKQMKQNGSLEMIPSVSEKYFRSWSQSEVCLYLNTWLYGLKSKFWK